MSRRFIEWKDVKRIFRLRLGLYCRRGTVGTLRQRPRRPICSREDLVRNEGVMDGKRLALWSKRVWCWGCYLSRILAHKRYWGLGYSILFLVRRNHGLGIVEKSKARQWDSVPILGLLFFRHGRIWRLRTRWDRGENMRRRTKQQSEYSESGW